MAYVMTGVGRREPSRNSCQDRGPRGLVERGDVVPGAVVDDRHVLVGEGPQGRRRGGCSDLGQRGEGCPQDLVVLTGRNVVRQRRYFRLYGVPPECPGGEQPGPLVVLGEDRTQHVNGSGIV